MVGSTEAITRKNGYEKDAYTYYPVLIVGAGASGIAMGCRLKEALGFDQFHIVDRQSGVGGTWWINRYPGVACDVPAVFYSFSFAPNHRWTSTHPQGPEIVQYLQDVCEKYRITDKIELNTSVAEARWLEDEELWEVTLTHMAPGTGDLSEKERQQRIREHGEDAVYLGREKVRAKILASAVGGLVEPKAWPDHIPGRETFEGKILHSARWDYDVDMNDKDVVVVGTGCSAAQFVPRLTKAPFNAKSVTQIMRSPPWVVPRPAPPFGEENWAKWSPTLLSTVPGLAYTLRAMIYAFAELDFYRIFGRDERSEKARARIEAQLLKHMRATVPEKYHEILTPDYGVGCKRRIFDATWFPGLNDPKIELTTLPITSIQPREVTLGPGRSYPDPKDETSSVSKDQTKVPADVIVLANGFDVTNWLHPLKVVGKGGKLLHDVWDERGGPQAYLGNAMDGFPNFFIIFGPNTATGHSSVILASENMINYSLKFMKPILDGDVRTYEVKKEAEVDWARDIQEKLKDTVFATGGCQSWYKTDNGWNSTDYPYSQTNFTLRCMFPKWNDWTVTYTRKGLSKHRVRQALKYIAFAAAIVGMVRTVQAGRSLLDIPKLLRQYVRFGLLSILGTVNRGIAQVQSRI